MTDDMDRTDSYALDLTEQIEANYTSMREFADSVPDGMRATHQLLHFYAVYSDENGDMEPEQDKLNTQFLGAIARLEGRIVAMENALTEAGIFKPRS